MSYTESLEKFYNILLIDKVAQLTMQEMDCTGNLHTCLLFLNDVIYLNDPIPWIVSFL